MIFLPALVGAPEVVRQKENTQKHNAIKEMELGDCNTLFFLPSTKMV
jgi:hypothetical protein